MAAAFIESDPTKNARVHQALRAIREGRAILGQEIAAAIQKRDGDGSQAAHYDVYAAKMGYVANDFVSVEAASKAGFDEMNSLYIILTKPTGQGDAAGAALDNACAKFGV